MANNSPTGFVATCECGVVVGAMDAERTDRKAAGEILGQWRRDGLTVKPKFGARWQVQLGPRRCKPRNLPPEAR